MTLNILDWTEAYLKYKDSIQRKIKILKKFSLQNEIVCEMKDDSIHKYLCVDDLSNLKASDIKGYRVSCLNSKKNLDWLISNWQELKSLDSVFFFANPQKAVHWSINPRIHDGITDKSSIKSGLNSLFDSIQEV